MRNQVRRGPVDACNLQAQFIEPPGREEPACAVQVTNPPIDPLREGLVMSLGMRLGARGNLLAPGPDAYKQIILDSPILLEAELEAVKQQDMVPTEVQCYTLFGLYAFCCFSIALCCSAVRVKGPSAGRHAFSVT
jgi:Glutamate synthase central domain